MKIVLLTTETVHHAYFAKKINEAFPLEKILAEKSLPRPQFETRHPFEDQRDEYETGVFFGSRRTGLKDVADIKEVYSVNDAESVEYLNKVKPDIVIVFGAGRLRRETIDTCREGIINLHGGDPEEYRGLDTHLWAIYNGDFKGLVTTLHRVNERLDDGDIILRKPVSVKRGALLHELRRYNTEACVELTLAALDIFKKNNGFISRPQKKKGRYYSFMPRELKEICVSKFREYARKLK